MCLMLYLATDQPVPEQAVGRLTVAAIDGALDAKLANSFSKPFRRHVGGDGGCSCDFQSVLSEVPISYFDGMFQGDDPEARSHSAACVRSLLGLVSAALAPGGTAELCPSWADEEELPPKGRIDLCVQDVVPEEFFFVERFLYVMSSR